MNTIKVLQENGRIADHSLEGVIFNRSIKDGQINYIDALKCSYGKMEIITDLSYYCSGHEELVSQEFLYLLVRHGKPGNWSYYPLYLLFSDADKRYNTATAANKLPPKSIWVERKKEEVKRTLKAMFPDSKES